MSERAVEARDGCRLRTRVDGDPQAPPLLLINSLGCDLTMWDGQLPRWTTTHRVIRYDQRGHGGSDAPPGPYTIEQLGADTLVVLDGYGTGRADVCGISLGGLVGLWLGAKEPKRVGRLVLADTAGRVGTEQAWRDRAATVRGQGMNAVTDLVLERFFSPQFRARRSAALAQVEAGLRAMSAEGYAAACDALAVADLRHLAADVEAPVLVVVGTADVATPPENARALRDALPDATLVEIPDAGHLANLEAPELFTDVVHDFLIRSGSRT